LDLWQIGPPICAPSYSKELLVVELEYHQFFIALTNVFPNKIKKLAHGS
jgi:hypothetical protein